MSDHLAPVRALFAALSPEDRRKIFQEFSLCACKDLGDLARKHPATAVGALVGGLIGALVLMLKWLRLLFGHSPQTHRHCFKYIPGTIRALRVAGGSALYREQWRCDCGFEETTDTWGFV